MTLQTPEQTDSSLYYKILDILDNNQLFSPEELYEWLLFAEANKTNDSNLNELYNKIQGQTDANFKIFPIKTSIEKRKVRFIYGPDMIHEYMNIVFKKPTTKKIETSDLEGEGAITFYKLAEDADLYVSLEMLKSKSFYATFYVIKDVDPSEITSADKILYYSKSEELIITEVIFSNEIKASTTSNEYLYRLIESYCYQYVSKHTNSGITGFEENLNIITSLNPKINKRAITAGSYTKTLLSYDIITAKTLFDILEYVPNGINTPYYTIKPSRLYFLIIDNPEFTRAEIYNRSLPANVENILILNQSASKTESKKTNTDFGSTAQPVLNLDLNLFRITNSFDPAKKEVCIVLKKDVFEKNKSQSSFVLSEEDYMLLGSSKNTDEKKLFILLESLMIENGGITKQGHDEIVDTEAVEDFILAMRSEDNLENGDVRIDLSSTLYILSSFNTELASELSEKISISIQDKQTLPEIFELVCTLITEKLKSKALLDNNFDQKAKPTADKLDYFRSLILNDNLPLKIKEKVFELEIKARLLKDSESSAKQYTAIDILTRLPYRKSSPQRDFNEIITTMDENIFGMKTVKTKVSHILAKHSLNRSLSPKPILLHGEPGLGKTYFCLQLAKALNRPHYIIPVGALDSGSGLNGSNPVYIGSDAGYVINSLLNAQVNNPLVILDEIDKIGLGKNSGAQTILTILLQILDPLQKQYFRDNFIDTEIDISSIWFIATGNYIKNVPEPLLDRFDIINIPQYSAEEKREIFANYIWERNLKDAGLTRNDLHWDSKAVDYFVDEACDESIRDMDNKVSSICGQIALDYLQKRFKYDEKNIIDIDYVKQVLELMDQASHKAIGFDS